MPLQINGNILGESGLNTVLRLNMEGIHIKRGNIKQNKTQSWDSERFLLNEKCDHKTLLKSRPINRRLDKEQNGKLENKILKLSPTHGKRWDKRNLSQAVGLQ